MKRAVPILIGILLFGILATSPMGLSAALAQGGTTYYLSPSGDDGNSGASEAEAWATFDRAWQDIYPGDTLILLDGVYYQSLNPNKRNGEPGNPITIRAKNDGQAVIDGEYQRIPVKVGDTWPGPIGNYFVIEGIVARNSSRSVYQIWSGHYNVFRRVSGYNANTDENAHVFDILADYNLIEDSVASGTGRKMIMIYKGNNNIIRRCFADWREWDGREWCDAWPWGDNIQVYSGNNNIIENSIGYGPVPLWSIAIQAPDASPGNEAIGNKVLGSIAIRAGMNADGTPKEWGDTRPQPTSCTAMRDFNWPGQRAGFQLFGDGELRDNLFQDVFAWGSAGLGLTTIPGSGYHPSNASNQVNRATIVNNGLDNPCGPYPCQYGGEYTDALQRELNVFDSVENSYIEEIFVDWPNYPDGERNMTSMNGEGARLTHRYVDGVSTDEPLWPWPMEDRIQAELGISVTGEMQALIESFEASRPWITQITTNAADYPNNEIPKYEKLEITFQVENSVAGNFQLPYDPNPPNGIDLSYPKHQGISVDALFLPPGQTDWNNAYQQPAFYYKDFDDQIKRSWDGADREWYYPTGESFWKARFAPNEPGTWQYKLRADDASGSYETAHQTFAVVDSSNQGFVKASSTDRRYFEFDDGTTFHALGFNGGGDLSYGGNLEDPVLDHEGDFQTYQRNKINLLRVWISGLYGATWPHYLGGRNIYDGYLPRPGILPFYDPSSDRTTMTLHVDYELEGDTGWFDACRFERWNDPEAVKQNTNYRIRIKYRGIDISGPRNSGLPYGFVGKLGGWHPDCYEPGTSTVVTNYGLDNAGWDYVEGVWNSGSNSFLPRLYMALENVTAGEVYVDSVSVQEDLGNGQYGPEIMIEPSMEYELYFPQEESYALDKLVELAGQYGIYLKLVVMDKNDKIYYKIEDNGDFVLGSPDNVDGFYGVGRTVNKTRWLQQAWWRYVQARWGYSPSIHSWELTNEGDPWKVDHYAQTDELGKSMHCRAFGVPVGAGDGEACTYDHPNDHLVTTSFWHSFPGEQFWANPRYPNVDYADVHAYISTGWQNDPSHEDDAAKFHLDYSADVRSNIDWYSIQNNIPTKPVIRGETGIDFVNQQAEQPDLALDSQGIWLHNFLWSTLDPGALTELYWWGDNIRTQPGPDGQPGLYEIYGNFSDFVSTIPLNNGDYQDAAATVSNPDLRVVGQKDLVQQSAHLWIQNKQHTWRNVVDGASIPPLSGTVTLSGFQGDQYYAVQWWDTYATDTAQQTSTETVISQTNGEIVLTISDMVSDSAVRITPSDSPPTQVMLTSFVPLRRDDAILVTWETATEIDTVGFNLYRAESPGDTPMQLNGDLIASQAPGSPMGASYQFLDEMAAPGGTYYYWLDTVAAGGQATRHGPAVAWAHRGILPLVARND